MANFFLGFPVPRAKIADMIEGFAPPLAHIANHIPGGSDPLVASMTNGQILVWNTAAGAFVAQTPSGNGIANLYAETGYYWRTLFESIDNFYQVVTNSGEISADYQGITVKTGATQSSTADFRKAPKRPIVTPVWTKNRAFKCVANFSSSGSKLGEIWITTGGYGAVWSHIGFKVIDGVLYGTYRNYANTDTVTIETLGAGAYDQERTLECVWTVGGNIVFTVNGSDYTITSPTITGDGFADRILQIYVTNPDPSSAVIAKLSEYKFYQSA